MSSLAVFLSVCFNTGSDPLELADSKFLVEVSTGNLTDTYLFDPSNECIYVNDWNVYDYSSVQIPF